MGKFRRVVFYKSYFSDFMEEQNPKIREKILWVIKLLEHMNRVPLLKRHRKRQREKLNVH